MYKAYTKYWQTKRKILKSHKYEISQFKIIVNCNNKRYVFMLLNQIILSGDDSM